MKKIFSLLGILIAAIFSVSAQNCSDNFLGTKTLYAKPGVKYSAVPAGYKAVFINHVGRHGARHLTKDVSTYYAYKLLLHADSTQALTANGEKLKQMVIAFSKIEKGNTKSISGEGRTELVGLGERMFAMNPDVFKGHLNFNVGITKEIRTKQSADAFLTGLKNKLQDTTTINEYNDDTDLRFYDLSPAYKKFEEDGEWVKYKDALEKKLGLEEVNRSVINQFFKPDLIKGLSNDDKARFVSDIFGFATIIFSVQDEVRQMSLQPAVVDFKQFFTCAQITALANLDQADEYYKKGPGMDNNGIQVRIAVPLLINFIKTSDDFMKAGKINAQLRFAHAETIAPVAALMNIATADKASTDISTIGKLWQASKVIQLSANIQWIFYQKAGSGKYLVKILLNEKEARISGMPTTNSPFYQWDKLRAFYLKKLQDLNVKMDDDMKAYLVNLK